MIGAPFTRPDWAARAVLDRVLWGAKEEEMMPLTNRLAAEFVGTFWLVLGGYGSARA